MCTKLRPVNSSPRRWNFLHLHHVSNTVLPEHPAQLNSNYFNLFTVRYGFAIWKLSYQSRNQNGLSFLSFIPNRIMETLNKDSKCIQ